VRVVRSAAGTASGVFWGFADKSDMGGLS
jgi:hypothetical protein